MHVCSAYACSEQKYVKSLNTKSKILAHFGNIFCAVVEITTWYRTRCKNGQVLCENINFKKQDFSHIASLFQSFFFHFDILLSTNTITLLKATTLKKIFIITRMLYPSPKLYDTVQYKTIIENSQLLIYVSNQYTNYKCILWSISQRLSSQSS